MCEKLMGKVLEAIKKIEKHSAIIAEKSSNQELRACEHTKEVAAACRMIHGFCEGSRANISQAHMETFIEWCKIYGSPEDFTYGFQCLQKDFNRGHFIMACLFHKFTSWPELELLPEGGQTNALAVYMPAFQKEVMARLTDSPSDQKLKELMPKLNEIPGLNALYKLTEPVDHKFNVHCKVPMFVLLND